MNIYKKCLKKLFYEEKVEKLEEKLAIRIYRKAKGKLPKELCYYEAKSAIAASLNLFSHSEFETLDSLAQRSVDCLLKT